MNDPLKNPPDVAALQALRATLPRPRPHHYEFAHRFLPLLFAEETISCMKELFGKNCFRFLSYFWLRAATRSGLAAADYLSPDGLKCDHADLPGGYRIAIITLPEAKFMNEA